MKYIKYFESESGVNEISWDEYYALSFGQEDDDDLWLSDESEYVRENWENFTIDEINELEKYAKCVLSSYYELSAQGVRDIKDNKTYIQADFGWGSKSITGAEITKLKDEWYIVKTNTNKGAGKLYKCDQFYSLIKLIKSI